MAGRAVVADGDSESCHQDHRHDVDCESEAVACQESRQVQAEADAFLHQAVAYLDAVVDLPSFRHCHCSLDSPARAIFALNDDCIEDSVVS